MESKTSAIMYRNILTEILFSLNSLIFFEKMPIIFSFIQYESGNTAQTEEPNDVWEV